VNGPLGFVLALISSLLWPSSGRPPQAAGEGSADGPADLAVLFAKRASCGADALGP
jgi:hypothetical protein